MKTLFYLLLVLTLPLSGIDALKRSQIPAPLNTSDLPPADKAPGMNDYFAQEYISSGKDCNLLKNLCNKAPGTLLAGERKKIKSLTKKYVPAACPLEVTVALAKVYYQHASQLQHAHQHGLHLCEGIISILKDRELGDNYIPSWHTLIDLTEKFKKPHPLKNINPKARAAKAHYRK